MVIRKCCFLDRAGHFHTGIHCSRMHRTSAGSMQIKFQYEEGWWAQSLPTTAKELLVTYSCWKGGSSLLQGLMTFQQRPPTHGSVGRTNQTQKYTNNQTQNWVDMGSGDRCGRKEDKYN